MKKITAILLSLVMAWNLGLMCASAADNQTFIAGVYQEPDSELNLLCVIPGETGVGEQFQVTLGDKELSVLEVSTAEEEQIPKTVYCLVDISGSMKGRMNQAQEVLYAISSGLHTNDNLVIAKMGNQITESPFLTNQDDIKAEIDSLAYTGEDTDLYSGLMHGLKFLQQGTEVHRMKALVVISDGCDDQGAGSTWKEAYEAVGKAGIPVYTAAMILSEADYEPAKELGSFARNSAGGIHFPKSEDNGSRPVAMTGEEIGTEILSAMADTMHLTVNLSEVKKSQKDTYLLTVAFQSQGGKTYRDSRELAAGELSLPDETKEETTTETALVPPVPDLTKLEKILLCLAGSVLILTVVITVLAVSSSRKKKREEEQRREAERLKKEEEERERLERERKEQERLEQERKEAERLEQERREQLAREEKEKQARREQELAARRARDEAARREQETFNALPKLNIRMSIIGLRNAVFDIQLVKGYEMTVGRNSRARIVLNANDTKLSGIHFVMYWDGGSVYVWDGQSRNGTAVNGVVVNHLGKVAVKPGDSIRAGSYEYRLYWEE